MHTRPCYSPELRSLSEARAFADLLDMPENSPDFYPLYRARAMRLISALIRVPFLLDCASIAATKAIPPGPFSADTQLDWDSLTDEQARMYSGVLRVVSFTRTSVQEIANALNLDRLAVADVIYHLHAAGLVYPDARQHICLSPLGAPAAADLESHNDAIRPHHLTRRQNRRQH